MLISVPDMKILLLDHETTGVLSMAFTQSEVMEREVFLFDRLDNSKRERMMHLKAVCILRPTEANISQLITELMDPKYGEYHLFFTNVVSDNQLKELAQADEHEVVQHIHEYFADYYPVYRCVFSLNVDSMVKVDPEIHQIVLRRVCDGLAGVLLSLRKKPMIRFQKSSEMCQRVAQEIGRRMTTERQLFDFPRTEQSTVLLIVDRREDPITPLLQQWTYQAMVHELFGINNNRVGLPEKKVKTSDKGKGKEDEQYGRNAAADREKKPAEIVLSADQDEFYRENMFLNWGDLGTNIKTAMAKVQMADSTTRNMKSIEEMKAFIENYPEFNKQKGNVAMHVGLLGDIFDAVQKRSLLDVSKVEQSLACQHDHNAAKGMVHEMLRNPRITEEDKIRLVLLYALRYETDLDNEVCI